MSEVGVTAPLDPRPTPSKFETVGFRLVFGVQILVVIAGSVAALMLASGAGTFLFGMLAMHPEQGSIMFGVTLASALLGWLVTLPHTGLMLAAALSPRWCSTWWRLRISSSPLLNQHYPNC